MGVNRVCLFPLFGANQLTCISGTVPGRSIVSIFRVTMDWYLRKIPDPNSEIRRPVDCTTEAQERPLKKVRLSDESPAGKSPERDMRDEDDEPTLNRQLEDFSGPLGDDDGTGNSGFEYVLPETRSDEAIGVYETAANPQIAVGEPKTTPRRSLWVKGQRSIYVDAFNLALDTVLEDEAHLFNERERHVFDQWKALDYESQYL